MIVISINVRIENQELSSFVFDCVQSSDDIIEIVISLFDCLPNDDTNKRVSFTNYSVYECVFSIVNGC